MRIFLLSGEPSGDLYGSLIVKAIRKINPTVEIFCVGEEDLVKAGAKKIRGHQDLSVVGFWEGWKAQFHLRPIKAELKKEILSLKPDLFLPISFSGFALPLARELKREGIKVIYLSPPQAWAWGRWRIPFLKRVADKVISFFPFEAEFYRRYGINSLYFGNPLLEILTEKGGERKERKKVLSFAPGSRKDEIERHQPFLRRLFQRLNRKNEFIGYFLLPPHLFPNEKRQDESGMIFATENRYEIILSSELVVGKLGTIALESVLLGKPYIGFYIPSFPTYLIGKFLVRTKLFSLPNLILNERAFPEFINPKCEELEEEIKRVREKSEFYKEKCLRVKERLSGREITKRIAEAILA